MSAERRRPQAPRTAKVILWMMLALLYTPIMVMLSGVALAPQWLIEVFRDEALMSALGNSVIVAVSASLLSTFIGSLAALALHRYRGKIRWALEGMSMISLIFPEIVFALSLLSWFFVLHFELGLQTVIIAHVSFSLSYVMMTVNARLVTLDPSLEDAARDLGASELTLLKTVILPLLKPAILGGFILSFLLSFDDFLITYFVNGVGQDTLPVKLYTAMKMGVSPKLNALSSLMFLGTFLVTLMYFRIAGGFTDRASKKKYFKTNP
jgi:spermidine/putrescine transport system permease protein